MHFWSSFLYSTAWEYRSVSPHQVYTILEIKYRASCRLRNHISTGHTPQSSLSRLYYQYSLSWWILLTFKSNTQQTLFYTIQDMNFSNFIIFNVMMNFLMVLVNYKFKTQIIYPNCVNVLIAILIVFKIMTLIGYWGHWKKTLYNHIQ